MNIEERIASELLHEQASLWFTNYGNSPKVMIKITSSSIKALIKGCKIEFQFGKDNKHQPTIFHTGVRIYDDPVHYISITGTQRFIDEHQALENILNCSTTEIQFYNELNQCVAIAILSFEIKIQMKALNFLGNTKILYAGEFNTSISKSLDCFDYSLEIDRLFDDVYEIPILVLTGFIDKWNVIENCFIGTNESNVIIVNDEDEGGIFESQVWVSLDAIFKNQLYKNPIIPYKNRTRELTDIFAISEYGLFLIETKALGVISTSLERTMDRKVKGLQQQISTAIDQLTGAAKRVSANVDLFSPSGVKIEYNHSLLPHCIVLVSELFLFGDWQEIEYKMIKVMSENNFYLHVLDLREFMQYIGIARGSKDKLDYLLIKRVERFIENRDIHIRVKEAQNP